MGKVKVIVVVLDKVAVQLISSNVVFGFLSLLSKIPFNPLVIAYQAFDF